jgi:hypothetical protein
MAFLAIGALIAGPGLLATACDFSFDEINEFYRSQLLPEECE